MTNTIEVQAPQERVLLGGLNYNGRADFDYTMTELQQLAIADELAVVGEVRQNLDRVDRATYFGSGKVEEIKGLAQELNATTIVIDDELSPSQIANLEKQTGLHVLDRTELILEIFADRAHTAQAKIQVEIARLQYALPRIHPSANNLDQQRGGGGFKNRGSGETKTELNRRTIRKRISDLQQKLTGSDQVADTQQQRRNESDIPRVALVGYTNAGKSTTMNELLRTFAGEQGTDKQVFEKDMLFATLDTSVRKIVLPQNQRFLLSDTVGFVSHLPHNLIASFNSTLAEAAQADLLIQVIDFSDPNYREMMQTTAETLKEIGIKDIPMIYAFNKADRCENVSYPEIEGHDLTYSAKDSASIKLLAKMITDQIYANYQTVTLLIPFSEARDLAQLTTNTKILSQDYTETGTLIEVQLSPRQLQTYQKYQQVSDQN